MNQRPGCHLGWPAPPRSAGGLGGEADRISALADDLLLLILVRLGCAAAAARSGLLSRRWHGLWTRLPALVFRDVSLPSLEPALASLISPVSSSDAVCLLDIHLPRRAFYACTGEAVSSLLRTAALLSPEQLVLDLEWGVPPLYSYVELPCFNRATAISLIAASPILLCRPPDATSEFPALTTLVLTGCAVDDLAALVLSCPRLRVLRIVSPGPFFIGMPLHISIHSASLRELVLDKCHQVRRIDISTPILQQLTVSTSPHGDLSNSVLLAPKVDKVSWLTRYRFTTRIIRSRSKITPREKLRNICNCRWPPS
uniref:Uncharacterized protein n=1 Tax=Avena sativa TaxID=4498 RepID=A0ACD6ABR9_AVESA